MNLPITPLQDKGQECFLFSAEHGLSQALHNLLFHTTELQKV